MFCVKGLRLGVCKVRGFGVFRFEGIRGGGGVD